METKKAKKPKAVKKAKAISPQDPPREDPWTFDPDAFLASLTRETCPAHDAVALEKRTSHSGWDYYVCPQKDCFVFTGANELPFYLEQARRQLHDYYKTAPMQCQCYHPVTLSISRSLQNPNRLYFRCGKRQCSFFQWADQVPYALKN